MKTFPLLINAVLLALFMAGCGEKESAPTALHVAVSIPPQAYLVDRIAGDRVDVWVLIHPGESPATFQPTDQEISRLMKSQVYLRIGVPFEEGKWLDAFKSAKNSLEIADLREGLELRRFGEEDRHDHHDGEEDHGLESPDPHAWLGPDNLKTMAKTTAQVLTELDPQGGEQYEKGLEAFLLDVEKARKEASEILAPLKGRTLYVFHPAWGYFCDAFGLKQKALEIEGKDPTDEELTRLCEQIREDRAKVLFVQPQIAGAGARTAAKALGLRVETLDPLARDVLKNLRDAARAVAESYQ